MKHAHLTAAAALALSACAITTNGPIVDGGPVRADGSAMLGQATRVGRLIVTPQRIVEDSRCPMNARCIWAGRAVVSTRIDGAGWRETANLELGKPRPTHGTSVTLTSVQPEKMAGSNSSPAPYLLGYQGGY